MRKYLITLTVAAFGLALPAHAGFISLNSPDDGGPTFTPLPGNMVQVTGAIDGIIAGYQTPAECGAGLCLETASANFDTNFTGQLTSNNNYTTTGTGSFNFAGSIFDPAGSGTLIAHDTMSANITWSVINFVDDGNPSPGPTLSGTGIVTASSGDSLFEADFPLGGTFTIAADFLSQCGRFPPLCMADQTLFTELINGSLTPTPVPSPFIGKPGWAMVLCLAVLGLVRRYRNGVNEPG